MVVFPAVPVLVLETELVRQIISELEKLARLLGGFKPGGEAAREAGPARSIVASLKTINATLEEATRRGSLGPAGFTAIGREFEKIGATLRALGSDSAKSSK